MGHSIFTSCIVALPPGMPFLAHRALLAHDCFFTPLSLPLSAGLFGHRVGIDECYVLLRAARQTIPACAGELAAPILGFTSRRTIHRTRRENPAVFSLF